MNVFKTLDSFQVEQHSYVSKESLPPCHRRNGSTDGGDSANRYNESGHISAPNSVAAVINNRRNASGSAGRNTPEQFLTVNNYTTVQIPKPYQAKPRTQTPNDLIGVMSIMDEYHAIDETENSNIEL